MFFPVFPYFHKIQCQKVFWFVNDNNYLEFIFENLKFHFEKAYGNLVLQTQILLLNLLEE